MKIVYTTDQIALHGGIEKVLSQKANYLADVAGDEVYIITYAQQGRKPVYAFSKKIKFIDLGISYLEGVSYFNPKNIFKMFGHRKALMETLRKIKPDVVISCNYGPDFYFLPYSSPVPVIKEFHSSRFFLGQNKKGLFSRITSLLEKRYAGIAVLNADETGFYNAKNIEVIPNPTENNRQSPLNEKKVLAAGRISPVKNFGELIEIWKLVTRLFPEWELHFYGQDYLGTQEKLQKKIDKAGLESVIKFMGVSENMAATMQNYSIYALTSETECFPMVLLEALSSGLPVVAYDVPTGPRHIVSDESDGYLIEAGNQTRFADRLINLMKNEEKRKMMGENGVTNSMRFALPVVMDQWKSFINKTLVEKHV